MVSVITGIMGMFVPVAVIMSMVVGITQYQRANDVDRQTHDGDGDGLGEMDGFGGDQVADGTPNH